MAGDQDRHLKITTKNHLLLHYHTIILMLIGGFCIYAIFNFNKDIVLIFLIFWTLDIIPVIFLHYDYWEVNKDEEYEVLFDRLVRFKGGKREDILGSDIDKITVYLCPSMYKGSNLHFLGIEAYYFARVELNSGEKFYLTCLLHPKLDDILKTLKGVRMYRKKTFFPSLK